MTEAGPTQSHLAAALRRLAAVLERGDPPAPLQAPPSPAEPPVQADRPTPADTARRMLDALDLRNQYFDRTLFADPAWCLMLDIYVQMSRGRRMSVSSASTSARAPGNTSLRWIKLMTERGLLLQQADPADPQRAYVQLSAELFDCMTAYLEQAGGDPVGRDVPLAMIFPDFQ